MKSLEEFSILPKSKMVVALVEIMVWQGYDITNFIYQFRSYKKADLIREYTQHLKQEPNE